MGAVSLKGLPAVNCGPLLFKKYSDKILATQHLFFLFSIAYLTFLFAQENVSDDSKP